MKKIFLFLAFIFGIVNGHIGGGGGGCGFGGFPPPPPPPPPGPCGPRPFFPPPPITSPCQQQPRPFYPQPPQSPYPTYGGYPCQQQQPYGPPPHLPHPYGLQHQLPPLLQPPRPYPEISPEEYQRISNENKLIKETIIRKGFQNIPDPFEDAAKKLPPFIPDKYYPEPRPVPIPNHFPQPGIGLGCGGFYPEQQQQQQQQQFRPYPPYPPYGQIYLPPRITYPPPPYPQPPPPPPPPPQNCCTRCGGCRSKAFGQKTVSNSTAEEEKEINETTITENKKELQCNNEKLKEIMQKNISLSIKEAKVAIHEAAESTLGQSFQVICSLTDFEYVIRSSFYCQIELEKGICYAFKTG